MRLSFKAVLAATAFLGAAVAGADFNGPTPLAWRWAEPTPAAPAGKPQVTADSVTIAVGGRIYCLERTTGNLMWRYPAGEPIQGSFREGCVVVDGHVVAAGDEKSVYCVNAKTGALEWQHLSPDPITTNVVVAGDTVVFGTNNNKLAGLRIGNGQLAFATPFTVADGLHPRIENYLETVIFSTGRGRLAAFDVNSGKQAWEQKFSRLSVKGPFSVQDDRIYVNTGSFLVAVRANSGGSLWQQTIARELDFRPATSPDAVATATTDGKLYIFTSGGKQISGKPIDLGASLTVAPTFVGKNVLAPTANGAINLIDTAAAQTVWSYVIPAIVVRQVGTGTGGGGSAGLGDGGGGGGGAIGGGQAGGGTGQPQLITTTQASGVPVVAGDSLFVLTRDGSLLMFDKNLGVDLTAPMISQLWPEVGSTTAGKAPMELVFKLEDLGIGINESTVKVMINGRDYIGKLSNDGFLSVLIISGGANQPLQNGKVTVTVTASDWLGNMAKRDFVLTIDNSLNALGSPPRGTANNQGGGAGNPGGGRGGRGGGLGGDGR